MEKRYMHKSESYTKLKVKYSELPLYEDISNVWECQEPRQVSYLPKAKLTDYL